MRHFAIVVSLLLVLGCYSQQEPKQETGFDHARNEGYVAFIVNEIKKDVPPDPEPQPDPDPEKCACKGTGIITHGDGHTTPCPYHGEGAASSRQWRCRCDTDETYCDCKNVHSKCSCKKKIVVHLDRKRGHTVSMQELGKAYDVLNSLFSKKGYRAGEYLLKSDLPMVVKISSPEHGLIDIDFVDEKPQISVKKIFTIKIDVLGISLGESGGVVKLDNFPDKSFDYEEDQG